MFAVVMFMCSYFIGSRVFFLTFKIPYVTFITLVIIAFTFLSYRLAAVSNIKHKDDYISTNDQLSSEGSDSYHLMLQCKSKYYRTRHRRQALDNEDSLIQHSVESDVIDKREMLCGDKCKRSKAPHHLGNMVSNMSSWSYHQTVECPYLNISEIKYSKQRQSTMLYCNISSDLILSVTWTNDETFVASFGDKCVDMFIRQCYKENYRIQSIVHYVWYMRGELSFVGFTSLLSVIRFVNPCMIMFHGHSMPYGPYWNFIVSMFPHIIHMKYEQPDYISGQKIKHKEHSSDVMRIAALQKYGGIYLDTDTLIVNSIESLRNHQCVMSSQSSGLLSSAFVMAEKSAVFLQLWMNGYRYRYNPNSYVYNAMIYPMKVAREHTNLINIEYATISRPVGMTGRNIYNNTYATYNWSHIYGIHLYSRIYDKQLTEYTIRTMNTTAGSIFRHIIFGNKEVCK